MAFSEELLRLLLSVKEAEFETVPGARTELYWTLDQSNNDLLCMLRMPYIATGPGATQPSG